MEKIDIQNFNKYYRKNDGNATLARVGHVNAVIEELNSLPNGAGLEGTQYVFVQANGTDIENATELQAAYDTATTMSPSATNRITIVAAPGNYNFGTSAFVMDTEYIDLVSLDGNRSIIFNSSNAGGTISITANDVFVKGINVLTKNFTIATNLAGLRVENCQGGDFSFGGDPTFGSNPIMVSGTFTNCQGGDGSFGGFGTASGIFTNCVGGVESFGTYGIASGTFNSCKGGFESFGSFTTASGNFNNCIGDGASFGYFGIASGTFTDCVGGDFSFSGNGGTASGTFNNCTGGIASFSGNGGNASGTFNNCVGGDLAFAAGFGNASGTFTNCVGGNGAFGNFGGTLLGKLYYCRLTSGTFQTVSGGGRTIYCIDGVDNTNNQ